MDTFTCTEVGCSCDDPVTLLGEDMSKTGEIGDYVDEVRLYEWAVKDAASKGVDLSDLSLDTLVPLVRAKLKGS